MLSCSYVRPLREPTYNGKTANGGDFRVDLGCRKRYDSRDIAYIFVGIILTPATAEQSSYNLFEREDRVPQTGGQAVVVSYTVVQYSGLSLLISRASKCANVWDTCRSAGVHDNGSSGCVRAHVKLPPQEAVAAE
ncbi:hypothetical protein RB195_025828 [Necator americanus]|uniref:Uncharacterized protein n=1 Tax=Necator americanus TaxID=51031 RepID=A0ABR1EU29_NECAM